MFIANLIIVSVGLISFYLVLRLLSKTSLLYIVKNWWRLVEDSFHAYQFYKVPKFNEHMQENQLYRKVIAYLNSLPSVEDSDFVNLFSGNKTNEINLAIDSSQIFTDTFLSARVYWKSEKNCLVLKIRRKDKRRILGPYLQHIHTVSDEIDMKRKEVKLYINAENEPERNGRWKSIPFTHPATIDTAAIDSDLLYGPSGTGKSSFVAGMAKFLCYDIYDVDLSKVADDSDLKMLLLQTTNKSMIVIEDLDKYLVEKSTAVSLSGFLNFMDGIFSCCSEERVMVFTVNAKDHVDPTVLRPGRIDVHIHFPLCDFPAFKTLASSHLGIKEHKLFPQVEEIFQTGASLSPAEIGEIMITNRTSPTRALKSVITALQTNSDARVASKMVVAQKLSHSGSTRSEMGVPHKLTHSGSTGSGDEAADSGGFGRESVHMVREFRKLYGLLRMRSSRKESIDLDSVDKENPRLES